MKSAIDSVVREAWHFLDPRIADDFAISWQLAFGDRCVHVDSPGDFGFDHWALKLLGQQHQHHDSRRIVARHWHAGR